MTNWLVVIIVDAPRVPAYSGATKMDLARSMTFLSASDGGPGELPEAGKFDARVRLRRNVRRYCK
jgi:hypothetical protein